ncbi:hypothetical protein [Streptomyces niger]|uniref:hypothetical protein n=1 Tax=Streptomyces niger TaxID=66373 RepID=UPI00069A9EEA|nr:hypothetical protein [Streptomyces niger]
MQRRTDELTEYRRRIAELTSGEELVLPAAVVAVAVAVAVMNRMRPLGGSERRVRLERDSWFLLQALEPEAVPQRVREKNASFDGLEMMRLYLACDRSVDWDPLDPRVDRLIDDLDAWEIACERESSPSGHPQLVFSRLVDEATPAWQRILETLARRAEWRRTASHQADSVDRKTCCARRPEGVSAAAHSFIKALAAVRERSAVPMSHSLSRAVPAAGRTRSRKRVMDVDPQASSALEIKGGASELHVAAHFHLPAPARVTAHHHRAQRHVHVVFGDLSPIRALALWETT